MVILGSSSFNKANPQILSFTTISLMKITMLILHLFLALCKVTPIPRDISLRYIQDILNIFIKTHCTLLPVRVAYVV